MIVSAATIAILSGFVAVQSVQAKTRAHQALSARAIAAMLPPGGRIVAGKTPGEFFILARTKAKPAHQIDKLTASRNVRTVKPKTVAVLTEKKSLRQKIITAAAPHRMVTKHKVMAVIKNKKVSQHKMISVVRHRKLSKQKVVAVAHPHNKVIKQVMMRHKKQNQSLHHVIVSPHNKKLIHTVERRHHLQKPRLIKKEASRKTMIVAAHRKGNKLLRVLKS